jgi:hypothetical protein
VSAESSGNHTGGRTSDLSKHQIIVNAYPIGRQYEGDELKPFVKSQPSHRQEGRDPQAPIPRCSPLGRHQLLLRA